VEHCLKYIHLRLSSIGTYSLTYTTAPQKVSRSLLESSDRKSQGLEDKTSRKIENWCARRAGVVTSESCKILYGPRKRKDVSVKAHLGV